MRFVNLAMEGGAPAELVLSTVDDKGTQKTFTRVFLPPARLILFGGGHVSQPLCRYAADLEFAVTVVDDRPSFANTVRFPDAERVVCDGFCQSDFGIKHHEIRLCLRDYAWTPLRRDVPSRTVFRHDAALSGVDRLASADD